MDWDLIRVFLAVARQGQLLGAGRRLGLNHATVARKLTALEQDLGVVLFDRRPTGTALTQAGERLLPAAERIEAEVLQVAADLSASEAEAAGTVRLGAPDGLGNTVLARLLPELTARHPNLTIELVPLPRSFSLSRREADMAIGLDRPTEGRLMVTKLADYALSAYAARSYLARVGTPADPGDLSAHTVVTGVADFAYAAALDYTMALAGTAGRVFRCASVIGQFEAIRSGAGVGILHDFMVPEQGDLVRVLPSVGFRRSYWLLTHPDTHEVKRVAVVRAFLAERLRQGAIRGIGTGGAASPT